MWVLDNAQLPTIADTEPNYAPLVYLETGTSLAPLCVIDFQANYTLPGTYQLSSPIVVPAVTNAVNTIDVGELVQVDAIAVGGATYMPALNPAHPRSGEFVLAGNIATLIPIRPLLPGLPVQVIGGAESTPTDYVDPSILQVFNGLPVSATLSWSLSAENHPSGSIALEVVGDADCAIVDRAFKKGSELTFAGIGFSVSSYSKTLESTHSSPGRRWKISVSLGGKWEAKTYQNPVFLIPSANPPIQDDHPYKDPERRPFDPVTLASLPRPTRVTVGELAERAGAKFVGFSSASTRDSIFNRVGLKPFPPVFQQFVPVTIPLVRSLDVWSVPLDRSLSRGATGQWHETLDALKRQNGCFVDLTRPDAIYARDIESGARWAYTVPEIQIGFKGDTTNSPGIEGYAAEYQATKLAGLFSTPAGQNGESSRNDSQGNWKRRSPVIKTFISGTPNAIDPPANLQWIKNMGLNWDVSGTTSEWIRITTHDGIEVHKKRIVYGLAFLSTEVTKTVGDKKTPVQGLATSFWQVVQTEEKETRLDPDTRYITGGKTVGSRKGRYKQETDELELLGLEGTDKESQYEATLYRFQDLPIYAVEQKRLTQLASFYKDVQREPVPMEVVKRFLSDGTSVMVGVEDPNFVEPMFEQASCGYSNSFSHTKNPGSTEKLPLPDLTQGEEKLSEHSIYIQPSKATTTLIFGNGPSKKFSTDDDQYVQFESEVASQNSGFADFTAKRTFATSNGRPSEAQKLPPAYEKEEPEQDSGHPDVFKDPQEARFDYVLCTPGNSPNDPSTSSIGYSYANYLAQGITGALTDLKYQDIQGSMEYSVTIPTNFVIRPMDYAQINDGEAIHLTRVISIENTILLQGHLDGYPLVVAPQNTQLKCGIDRDIPVTITRRPIVQAGAQISSRTFGLTIGEIIPPNLQGRGNY